MVNKFIFGVVMFVALILMLIILILACAFIIQIEVREIFEVDIFAWCREPLQKLFAVKSSKVFTDKKDVMYVAIPAEALRNVRRLDKIAVEEAAQNVYENIRES